MGRSPGSGPRLNGRLSRARFNGVPAIGLRLQYRRPVPVQVFERQNGTSRTVSGIQPGASASAALPWRRATASQSVFLPHPRNRRRDVAACRSMHPTHVEEGAEQRQEAFDSSSALPVAKAQVPGGPGSVRPAIGGYSGQTRSVGRRKAGGSAASTPVETKTACYFRDYRPPLDEKAKARIEQERPRP